MQLLYERVDLGPDHPQTTAWSGIHGNGGGGVGGLRISDVNLVFKK